MFNTIPTAGWPQLKDYPNLEEVLSAMEDQLDDIEDFIEEVTPESEV